MAYPRDTIEKVKTAYLSGKYNNIDQIAKEFGIKKRETIDKWSSMEKWGLLKEKLAEKIEAIMIDEVAEQKASYAKRQARLALQMQEKAETGFKQREARQFKNMELIALAEKGCDLERKALGIDSKDNNTTINIMNIFDLVKMLENKNEQ